MVVTLSFLCVPLRNYISLCASLIGVTALIFVAKGNVLGQILTVLFSVFYALISFASRYYGEMITYMCMTAPIAFLSVISWLRNPFAPDKAEVRVARMRPRDTLLMLLYAALVTFAFYFILAFFHTDRLILSTVSITTSFLASYLTYRRSKFYALAYAANDLVLILLWILASVRDISNAPMIFCFLAFLANDIYGYINWSRMEKRQRSSAL